MFRQKKASCLSELKSRTGFQFANRSHFQRPEFDALQSVLQQREQNEQAISQPGPMFPLLQLPLFAGPMNWREPKATASGPTSQAGEGDVRHRRHPANRGNIRSGNAQDQNPCRRKNQIRTSGDGPNPRRQKNARHGQRLFANGQG